MTAGLQAHLATGASHTCHCWAVIRTDGVTLGFTDHDGPLAFEGITFTPHTGLSARALSLTTGLSVNNTDVMGILSDDAITEADITAGRYDAALVRVWLVVWDDPALRQLRFAGHLGEITRAGAGFQAELRGLTEGLNQPQGRSYLTQCSAVLGDARCRFDLGDPAYRLTAPLADIADDGQTLTLASSDDYNDHWFSGGQCHVVTGAGTGLQAVIRADRRISAQQRVITLWDNLRAPLALQDQILITAGCDKAAQTCRIKFANMINFQGFPDIPGDDWLIGFARADGDNSGTSRRNT
jgi:uncharacterized phage protein (TIGR02218 family)